MFSAAVISLFSLVGVVVAGEPVVNCTAPRSPEHGQAFLYQDGQIVKFVCEPGYRLQGKELARCVMGEWEGPDPLCLEIDDQGNPLPSDYVSDVIPQPRPLFNWGDEDSKNEIDVDKNSTEDMLSDEARMHMLLYPHRRSRVISEIRTATLHSASELEEEEKRRSEAKKNEEKKSSSSTTIHLQSPPSVVYVRRTLSPGKAVIQDQILKQQYETAAVHMTVENDNGKHVQVVTVPARAAVSQDDKGQQAEDTLRNIYWVAQSQYARQPSFIEYQNGNPVVMTLTESQINWINSLPHDLRDQYLKDLYAMRAKEVDETARAQAFLSRYGDAYSMLYNSPLYIRQPLVVEDSTSNYDYSCHQAYSSFFRAPRLPNAHVARYDRRQNPNSPYNDYLSAVYRCRPGYIMVDPRYTELYCSKRRWVGTVPMCVPRG